LFAAQSSAQGMNPRAQLFNMLGGGRFGGPGGPGGAPGMSGGGGGGASGGGSKVSASADDYSNSLIVSASAEVMATITDMIEQIDQPASDVTEVRVFHLVNADPTELADQIAQLFPDETRTGSSGNQGGGFRFFGGPRGMGGAASQSGTSDRMKKKGKVLAVPDPRTSSLLISAASELMPQLAEMIERLDGNKGKPEVVRVFDIQNANITDVNQIMQDLFNRNNTMRANNNSSRSMVGQGNPLLQRQTQQQNNMSRTTGLGTTSGRSSSLGGGF
jgi:general secretion pathway protein D